MSSHNSRNSSPKNQFENLGQQPDNIENYNSSEHHQGINTHLHGHEHTTTTTTTHHFVHEQQVQHNHHTEPVEQLINQQIPSENLQPNNLYVGNPLLDSQYQHPPANPLGNAPAQLLNSQVNQIVYTSVPVVAAPVVLQSRTILSPNRLASPSTHLQRTLLSPNAQVKSKKMETQVKYEPYEKTVIQYEEVEKTIIEYQPVEKKIKVRVPVEKKVTDYRKCEYLVPAAEEKEEQEEAAQSKQQASYPVYSRLINTTTKRTVTAPSIPVQSRLFTSTINYQPINNLRQSTVLLQSQVVRNPIQIQQQQQQVKVNQTLSNAVSPKNASSTVTPRHINGAISPKGASLQQGHYFSAASNIQQVKQVQAPLSQSVSYAKSFVRTQPLVTRSIAPNVIHARQGALLSSTSQKPLWGYFNDRVINNSKTVKQNNFPFARPN